MTEGIPGPATCDYVVSPIIGCDRFVLKDNLHPRNSLSSGGLRYGVNRELPGRKDLVSML